ncbi:hypothetical protein [Phenylobacterium sp. J367]|uniref:hypothetical protein n=1 Tax=Phenylobacterium sp. J367 TaxID=2898435 RepID=UPI00215126E6|nr:hypothetical protein [Phenylobacterium sp. J367]MCR5880740.1 hypothetical protein [Phenylobacterium sp. J367]
MTTTTNDAGPARAATPWHLWVVGLLSLVWNGFGATDYTMTQLQGDAWLRQMGATEAQIAAMASFPSWMHGVWAIGVWGGLIGSLLLLLRRRWAFHAFVLSSAGAIISLAYQVVNPIAGMDLMFPLIIVAIALFLIWYAWTMTKRGVLR